MKLNVGCGPGGQFDGFINIDNSPMALIAKYPPLKRTLFKLKIISQDKYLANWEGVLRCDVSKRIPFPTGSINKIYSSHFLEHIPQEKGFVFLQECFRVLKEGGTFRLVVPDLLWHAERYVASTRQLIEYDEATTDCSAHNRFVRTVYGAYLNKRARYGLEHCFMYDLPSLTHTLRLAGFRDIKKQEFQEGQDLELAVLDSRPGESLHIEIRK